jgi:hypothetical protein
MSKRNKSKRASRRKHAVSKPELKAVPESGTPLGRLKRRLVRELAWLAGKVGWEYLKNADWVNSLIS